MLKSLYIKNFALVEELSIQFAPGLNIITGETGAGKTILVNAIAQLCGERSSVDLVKKGAPKAILEAEIEITPDQRLLELLKELTLDEEINSSIILRKEITARGTSRTFINDTPVSLTRLNEISAFLIDIHGQHQHQRLLHPENHIEYLDAFGQLQSEVEKFRTLVNRWRQKVKERDELKEKQLKSTQLQDMYRFQISELSEANLNPEELDELYAELKRLNNIEYLHQFATSIGNLLYEDEVNASGLIARAEDQLQKLTSYDSQLQEFQESLQNARATVEEIGRFMLEYVAGLQFDPQRLEEVQERINHLEFLLKKYQKTTIQELIDYLNEIQNFTADIDQYDEKIQALNQEIEQLVGQIEETGTALSDRRQQVAKEFSEKITQVLNKMGMPNARFNVAVMPRLAPEGTFKLKGQNVEIIDDRGFDQVVFELSSNTGTDFKPLHKIASGGEISRIMLGLKTLLAMVDRVPAMIFDEIDSGISGKVAQVVGLHMAELSKNHQVLCVTHLPQIAAFADAHYKVVKISEENRTFVDIISLDDRGREQEIAGLLGGQQIAEQTIENARHLIAEAQKMRSPR